MKLGAKDYLYVGLQGVVFVAYLFEIRLAALPIPTFLSTTGGIISVIGVILLILALLQLNKNLSPFPTPKSDAQLVRSGLYRYARHPIYSGILFIAFGYALHSTSLYKLLVAFGIWLVLYLKSSYEEKLLVQVYPDYGEYQQSTGRFFVKLF